jgi:hypothetical protein
VSAHPVSVDQPCAPNVAMNLSTATGDSGGHHRPRHRESPSATATIAGLGAGPWAYSLKLSQPFDRASSPLLE